MPSPDFTPTPEQVAAVDLFAAGTGPVIRAGAGAGKTSTLKLIARSTQRTGTYVAFNKAIVNDLERGMPMTVTARTAHSFAYRAVMGQHRDGRALLDRLDLPRVAPWETAERLGLQRERVMVEVPMGDGPPLRKVIQPTKLASHVMRAAAVFCNSADPEPGLQHFPYLDGIDGRLPDGRRGRANNRELAAFLLPYLVKAWADLTDPRGQLRFSPDVYLKLHHLGGWGVPGDYVMFDEAQDASPVMLAILEQTDAQVVIVGDSNQQIYEWRGAIDALDRVDPLIPRTDLTHSWRFGPEIAHVANVLLKWLDSDMRLVGAGPADSQVLQTVSSGEPDAVLCRTNAAAVETILSYQGAGRLAHLVGGSQDVVDFAHAAAKLKAGQTVGHPDLACFDNWAQVQEYVEEDPGGSDLRTMVKLLDNYGADIVVEALSGLPAEEHADVVVSTAHRAKGREWDRVRLGPDFDLGEGFDFPKPELRLLYVACTRARRTLDVTSCEPVRRLLRRAAANQRPALAALPAADQPHDWP